MKIKILSGVRLDDIVYVPDNDDHAEDLAEVISEKQIERLVACGAIEVTSAPKIKRETAAAKKKRVAAENAAAKAEKEQAEADEAQVKADEEAKEAEVAAAAAKIAEDEAKEEEAKAKADPNPFAKDSE